jgi:diguanylate cyclase (GGDEF)-like protein/PAS domain S-box-containing protein/putative nucleotidyltransferase with HDIG domain
MSPRTPPTDFLSTTASLYSAAIAGNEQGLVQERLLLAAIIEEAQEAIFSKTTDGIITTWNHAAADLFGYSAGEIVGRRDCLLAPPDNLSEEKVLVNQLCQGNIPPPFETLRQQKGGAVIPVSLTLSPVKNAMGEVVGVSSIARRIARQASNPGVRCEHASHEEHLPANLNDLSRHMNTISTTDTLTGLKTHRAFQEALRQELELGMRYDAPLSIVLLDIDRFKAYNDRFGHLAGDAVLRSLAVILRATVRSTDVSARYGGEEFAILLPETCAADAGAIAHRLRAAIEVAAWPLRQITASIGIATSGLSAISPNAFIAQAEAALLRSKECGRNTVTHASEPEEPEQEPALFADVLHPLDDLQTDSVAEAVEALKRSVRASYDATVESWSRMLDARGKETEGHNKRVTSLMVRLARYVGLKNEEVLFAKWGAQLHDIGKMAVPDEILHKCGPLTVEEWVEIRHHPAIAYEMLMPIRFLGTAVDIPYRHHEKWDGTGYPCALKGTAIPFAARLFAVIDVYDALCSDLSYRDGWPEHRVCEYLRRQSGTHFDPQAVEALLAMLEKNQAVGSTA